ncbi:hypothetical protein GDO81_019395 [Engystomops pustulosus]|uniref:Uncharacterized protein n=1 Tax=Engystomops pustulosus TaxID=76066 RepID=A0AAV6YIC9_ENGPU|nr:hypothetical protein GDO81_019395 [Engystomops pustulosus]
MMVMMIFKSSSMVITPDLYLCRSSCLFSSVMYLEWRRNHAETLCPLNSPTLTRRSFPSNSCCISLSLFVSEASINLIIVCFTFSKEIWYLLSWVSLCSSEMYLE